MNGIPLTIGTVAERFGVEAWKVRKLYQAGDLPPAHRMGCYRVVLESQLPLIESALRARGYLRSETPATVGA